MEQFDESEVREIGIGDRHYPELLRKIKKTPKALRIRGNLPPDRKIISVSGSRHVHVAFQKKQDGKYFRSIN